ncbi:transposase-like zinc-binding domain-containing protein [Gallibacterium anatis]
MKNCPFCQSAEIKKHGKLNSFQRYFCHHYHKTFIFR